MKYFILLYFIVFFIIELFITINKINKVHKYINT